MGVTTVILGSVFISQLSRRLDSPGGREGGATRYQVAATALRWPLSHWVSEGAGVWNPRSSVGTSGITQFYPRNITYFFIICLE